MTKITIKVLILEDNPYDAELNLKMLQREKWLIESRIANNEESFIVALEEFGPDIILSDYNLPRFTGIDALKISVKKNPLIPFIIVTGSLDEETAVNCIKKGAWDYVLKEHLVRLNPAVKYAIELSEERKQRKNAEKSLRESEDHYRILSQSSPDVIMRFDKNCRHTFVNDAVFEMLSLKPEVFLNKTHHEMGLFDPAMCDFWEAQIQKVLDTQLPNEVEFSIQGVDRTIDVEWRLFPELSPDGEVMSVLALARDISLKKKTEESLRINEERLQMALEATSDGLWDWNLKTNSIYFSPRFFTMLGYAPEEFAHNSEVFDKLLHPDDKFRYKEYVKDVIENQRNVFSIEYRLLKKNGSYAWMISRGKAFGKDEKGKLLRMVGTQVDITLNKRQDEIQKTIFDIGNAVVKTRNIDELFEKIQEILGRIIDTKNCYVALYDERNDTISLPFHRDEMDNFTEFPAGKTLTAYVIRTSKAQLVSEERSKELADAGEIEDFGTPSVSWLGVPLKLDNKTIGVFTVQSYDENVQYSEDDVKILEFVSDQIALAISRKKDEENLRIAKEKAEESDRLKSSFLSNMSHEIRTPMNAIVGFAELLYQENLSVEERNEYISHINQGTEALLTLIDDIIDISKIEAGQIRISKTSFNLNTLLINLHKQFLKTLQYQNRQNIDLILDTNKLDPGLQIISDSFRLKQVFVNLISNALKFTEEGKVQFGIKSYNKNSFSFYVKDTGIGIQEDKQKLIFDRFRQGHESKTKFYGGTGLGLAISKHLVELLGGNISLISALDKGSEFIFSIEYQNSTEDNQEIAVMEEELDINWEGKTILVAEDEKSNYHLLQEILKITKVKLLWARDGREVVSVFKTHPEIDLVLMDIQLPILNGYQATWEIREARKDIPVIAQTAYAMAGEKEKSLEAGCNDYISKPIKSRELFAILKKYLN